MNEKINEIDSSIYEGIKIFNEIKNCKIELNQYLLTDADKKYLSLYLGIINTKNKISKLLKDNYYRVNIYVSSRNLSKENSVYIINTYFSDIFNGMEFNDIEEYLDILLDKEIVKLINKINNIDEKIFRQKNKKLLMQIK